MNKWTKPIDMAEMGQGQKGPLNVLILDDVATDRLRLRRLLAGTGLDFTLFEAADLSEFRKQIDGVPMDLVFLDYHLAIDTGLDALRLLAAHDDQAYALSIMVTSVDRSDVAVQAMRSGCADYLIKEQLSVETIRKSVISALERKILFSAIAEAQNGRHAMRATVTRFARTCGPEIRSVLSALLRNAQTIRGQPGVPAPLADTLGQLEKGCNDIAGFLGEISELLDTMGRETVADERKVTHC